ncbi:MAG TPA: cytochrome-c peroxidase, partial [Elusimicrobiota bacterium]|nr:cytochrome-c peroxidase [Elusimicrobiota bacterium]
MLPAALCLWLAGSGLTGRARAAQSPEVRVDSAAVEAAWQRLLLSRFDMGLAGLVPERAYTPEEVALGRDMFFDARLSRDGTLSCSSCHVPSLAWTDRLPRALGRGRGAARKRLSRNTLSLLNVPFRQNFFWDGRASSVEEAALTAAANPDEMDMPAKDLVAVLAGSPAYAAR